MRQRQRQKQIGRREQKKDREPLLEVLESNAFSEFLSPELEAVFQAQPDALQKENIL